jgi:hypothetical protein
MSVNLTEFSYKELETLLTSVLVSEISIESRISERIFIYDKARANYPMDVPEVKKEHEELERLQLWHVQILNAIVEVKSREIVNSN